ncbi:MAG: CPBP family intramembrane glutamic endopeptidase [Chitinophagaceae bacterium]
MQGFLKTKPALNQFLILVSVVLVSFFVVGLIGTLVLAAATGIGIGEMADLAKIDLSKPGVIGFLRGLQFVQFLSLFVVPTIICTWLFSENRKKYLWLKKPSNPGYFIVGVGIMLIAIPFTNWLGQLNQSIPFPSGIEKWMKEQEDDAAKTIQTLLSRHTIKDLLLNLFFIAGLAAIGEELLFRGMAQRLLTKIFRNPWAGIVISAAIFSAMHMQFYGFLPRFALGVLLGSIYWYSGSLWVAILAHFIYDAVLIILAWLYPEMLLDDKASSVGNLTIAGLVSLVPVVVLLFWMKRRSPTSYETAFADDAIPVKDNPF